MLSQIKLDVKYPFKILNRIAIDLPCSWHAKSIICKPYVNYIYSKLLKIFNQSCNLVQNNGHEKLPHQNSKTIWIFWWQGYVNMPLIVKKCYNSVIRNANGYKVILITKNNIHQYSDIPRFIYKRLYNHNISLTHFSDVLRFNLLKNYGGLWLDSTMYCTSKITSDYFSSVYTSGKYNIEQSHNFACKWTEFLIGGESHSDIFEFINEFSNLYWKNHYRSIDYFQADYALKYAYNHNLSGFKKYVDTIAQHNNVQLYYLVNHLNNVYNIREYKKFTQNTNLFKLTYKKKFMKVNDGKKTYYSKLLNDELK